MYSCKNLEIGDENFVLPIEVYLLFLLPLYFFVFGNNSSKNIIRIQLKFLHIIGIDGLD